MTVKSDLNHRANTCSLSDMSFEEKRQLCILINNLDTKHLGKVVQIIHRALPDFLSVSSIAKIKTHLKSMY
jgi:ABC-type polysaccharide transport system permease subunit